MRRLIYGLRPPALDDLGLIPAIHQQAQSHGMVDSPQRHQDKRKYGEQADLLDGSPGETAAAARRR